MVARIHGSSEGRPHGIDATDAGAGGAWTADSDWEVSADFPKARTSRVSARARGGPVGLVSRVDPVRGPRGEGPSELRPTWTRRCREGLGCTDRSGGGRWVIPGTASQLPD
ncbi:hypothetical protein NDU88_001278 [Pleurodeles waltl]|uniref:Uncharacterized protein n=1 Tax=Pleurodeles waltl TaxID=8319 RepID=A0AAV7V7D9_PLEWA|nr:hypothetical protein NDU88_001278 [Pleurodeles waltl]